VIVVHKIALDPNKEQETSFRKAAGCARFAYNWALAEWREQYEAGGEPSECSLRRLLNAIKAEAFPWLLEVSKNVIQQAIKNLGAAFSHFFRRLEEYRHEPDPRRKKRLGRKLGYPKFKKKGRCRDVFRADNGPQTKGADAVRVDGIYVVLPVIGRIRMRERLRFAGQVKSAVVSRTADRWSVSLAVAVPDEVLPRKSHAAVGVDLGIATLATVSDGRDPYESPRPLRRLAKKRRRLGKALARKQGPGPGKVPSKNFLKAKRKLARLEARIANIRIHAAHEATTDLCRTCAHIVLEDLSVSGLLANHKLANSLADVGFSEFRRQVTYKAKRYACTVELAPRFFPSSKMCSKCGQINENLKLSDRIWTCPACGTTHDRDLNAAKNLASLAESTPATACGAAGAGPRRTPRTKLAATKQELSRGRKSQS
jgi:putative transposase